MRRGINTTEFWTWAVTMLSSSLFAGFMLWTQRSNPYEEIAVYSIKALVDTITGVLYIWARAKVKHHEALLQHHQK